jgi:hypothetical protein
MAFYKKRIVTRDTPEMVAERIAHRKALEQARKDRELAFFVITAKNFEAAAAFQDKRIADLLEAYRITARELHGDFLHASI